MRISVGGAHCRGPSQNREEPSKQMDIVAKREWRHRRGRRSPRVTVGVGCICFAALYILSLCINRASIRGETAFADALSSHSRRLLSVNADACENTSNELGVVFYLIAVLYVLLGIAIVCDEFFVPSMEVLVDKLNMDEDIAGATFMAAGTSAPELLAGLMAMLNPKADSEIGIGTIVGSTVFNILMIVGLSVLLPKSAIDMEPRIMTRDCFWYLLSTISVIGVFAQGDVHWWHGLIFTLMYVLYVAYLPFDRVFGAWLFAKVFGEQTLALSQERGQQGYPTEAAGNQLAPYARFDEETGSAAAAASSSASAVAARASAAAAQAAAGEIQMQTPPPKSTAESAVRNGDETEMQLESASKDTASSAPPAPTSIPPTTPGLAPESRPSGGLGSAVPGTPDSVATAPNGASNIPQGGLSRHVYHPMHHDHIDPFTVPEGVGGKILWGLSIPWFGLFFITIPDCKVEARRKWYLASFALSMGWLCILVYFLVGWATRIGCIWNIPVSFMGITFLAVGTSIPDLLASVAVAKRGFGKMAISNVLGSNIFDVWLALGLPWLLVLPFKGTMQVSATDLTINGFIMMGTLALFYFGVWIAKWRITIPFAISFVGLYVVFFVYCVLFLWVFRVA